MCYIFKISYFFCKNQLIFLFKLYSAGHLRRMQLSCCRGLSHEGFNETLRKLPLLEELEISQNKQLSNDSLEIVGQCCPLLKSLKYSRHPLDDIEMNDVAFAIAKTMPGLHHLKISGDELSNDGVLAVLDGCPLLETLDLKDCKYVSMRLSVWRRSREQIKDFGLPSQDYYSSVRI